MAWTKLWDMASVVWSYLHLPSLLEEDECSYEFDDFYYTPLGVDPNFKAASWTGKREYLIGTSGSSWLSESVREAANAAWRVGGQVFHLGPNVRSDPRINCLRGMDDHELGKLWASCDYVSGLRRTEGFEFPAAEGLICGARPVLFDRQHYHTWYDDLAEYIPEASRPEVIDSLEALFRGPYRSVKKSEQVEAQKRFGWPWIVHDFWKRCLDHV
jgi:hypothetical protein